MADGGSFERTVAGRSTDELLDSAPLDDEPFGEEDERALAEARADGDRLLQSDVRASLLSQSEPNYVLQPPDDMKASLLIVVGGLAAIGVAYLLALTRPPRDANIGAGLLLLAGIGIAGLGAICPVIATVVKLVHHRRGPAER